MLDILKCLKEEYNVIAIKAEFEAEGSRTDELVMLNEIVFRADMKLYIKIGGCEAVRDLDQCRLLGTSGIMAPMIESNFLNSPTMLSCSAISRAVSRNLFSSFSPFT